MPHEIILTKCPTCNNAIEIDQHWTPNEVNYSGGFILECTKCNHFFSLPIEGNINNSQVIKGAEVVNQYDNNKVGNKDEILEKYGLV